MSTNAYIAISFYGTAFIVQLLTTILCAQLFKQSTIYYRWAWLFLSLGFGVMTLSRASPILYIIETNYYNLSDAILSLLISLLLFAGIVGLKRQLVKDKADIDLLSIVNAHDLLTNALSKVEIHRRISAEFDRANRNGHCIALLEMDIDHFKLVNDRYGHQAGDDVLIGLVRSTNAILRTGDSLGRIGGEEFLILLPETNLDQAKEVAERLRISISDTSYSSVENQSIKITISIGISIYDPNLQSNKDKNALIAQSIYEADMAMYHAKEAGRNQVAVWNGSKKE
jgi:diguanylate cyclase (GGDEF)-like protein